MSRIEDMDQSHTQLKTFFRFDIEFTPKSNPPGLYIQLQEALRAWLLIRGFKYCFGALGGDRHIYGEVGPVPPATESVRQAMAEWLRCQTMCATVRLDKISPICDEIDMLSPITDWDFEIDTLSDAQVIEAKEYYAALSKWVGKNQKK